MRVAKIAILFLACLVNLTMGLLGQNECQTSRKEVKEGDYVVLDCDGPAKDKKWRQSYKGTRDLLTRLLTRSVLGEEKMPTSNNGSLILKNVTAEYFGLYICEFTDGTSKGKIKAFVVDKNEDCTWLYILMGVVCGPFALPMICLLIAEVKACWFVKFQFRRPFEFEDPLKYGDNPDDHDEEGCMKSCCSLTKEKWRGPTFTKWKTLSLFLMTKFVVCTQDVFTDIAQGYIHYTNNDYIWSGLTFYLILNPFVLSVLQFFVIQAVRAYKGYPMEWKDLWKCIFHLPLLQLVYHLKVFMRASEAFHKLETSYDEYKQRIKSTSDPETRRQIEDQFKEASRKCREVECQRATDFQQFAVVECFGESMPQAILQLGITFKEGRRLFPYSTTVFSSLLSIIMTFTGLYLKMPYWSSEGQEMIPNSKGKCLLLVLPVFFFTVVPRVYNLSVVLAFPAPMIVIPVIASMYVSYLIIFYLLIWWLGQEAFSWYFDKTPFLYSIGLSLISPCIRMFENGKKFVLLSSLLSLAFHFIMFGVMFGLVQLSPESLCQCHICQTDNFDLIKERLIVSAVLLAISMIGSYQLCVFSNGESRELIGYHLVKPLKRSLNFLNKDQVYSSVIESKWLKALKYLIQRDIRSIQGKTFTKRTIKLKKPGHVNGLIRLEDNSYETPFTFACKRRDYDAVQLFLEAPNVLLDHFNATNAKGETPFLISCNENDGKLVEMFLECKQADQIYFGVITDKYGKGNVWHNLVYDCGSLDIMKLIEKYSDNLIQNLHINGKDECGRTPYHISCMRNNVEAFKWFHQVSKKLNLRVQLDAQDDYGMTGFQLACYHKAEDIVKLLLKMKGSMSSQEHKILFQNDLWQELEMLVRSNHDLTQVEVIRVNGRDENGRTPYLETCAQNDIQTFNWFQQESRKHGVELDAMDDYGMTDFHMACNGNAKDIIKLLLTGPRKNYIFNNIIAETGQTLVNGYQQFQIHFQTKYGKWKRTIEIDSLDDPTDIKIHNFDSTSF